MGIVNDLKDEWSGLAQARLPWERYWRSVARYVLPQTEQFDIMLGTASSAAINAVVSTPVAAERSAGLYDMTSLWGIERLTAGMISLKTPEAQTWQELGTSDVFGREMTHSEKVGLETVNGYLFRVRHNPKSGFWPAHRSAMKSLCGFGDGWMYVKEITGQGPSVPWQYEFMPLPELYPAVGNDGMPERMFRVFRMSAIQLVAEFGPDKVGEKVARFAQDPKQRHQAFRVMHAVKPRDEMKRTGFGTRSAKFASYYCLPDEDHLIGEGGFYEFPFIRYPWSNTGRRPYSEGPIAYALGEIKSLNEMAKNELIAAQSMLRPAYGLSGKNMIRLNFNPGATNANLVTGDGKPLFAPLNAGVRPDFARVIMEQRRTSARELLYLNLWQIILNDTEDTATAALIKAQEKGEMLGPVGISLNEGLAAMNDREIGMLGRKGAFNEGSPLELPASMADADVSATFNSPLDRLRRMGELVGMQQLVQFVASLEEVRPGTAQRLDVDEMIDVAQEVLGAPAKILLSADDAKASRGQQDQMMQMMASLESMKQGGEAAAAIGAGGAAMAEGAERAAGSPTLRRLLDPATINAAAGTMQGAAQ